MKTEAHQKISDFSQLHTSVIYARFIGHGWYSPASGSCLKLILLCQRFPLKSLQYPIEVHLITFQSQFQSLVL